MLYLHYVCKKISTDGILPWNIESHLQRVALREGVHASRGMLSHCVSDRALYCTGLG